MAYSTEVISQNDEEGIKRAAELLKNGELVAFPTETVYGLGADSLNSEAVAKIYKAKGRPSDNPLISHICEIEQLIPLVKEITPQAKLLIDNFWPGPLTIIMEKSDIVPSITTGGLNTVAVRMPSHEGARKLLKECGIPVAAPSANLSGKPSPTTAEGVFDDMNGRIPMIIDGGECSVGVESTVIDITGKIPCVLRPGGVTVEQLRKVLGDVDVHASALKPLESAEKAASPGMKYKHYAPNSPVHIVKGENARERIAVLYDKEKENGGDPLIFANDADVEYYGDRRVYNWGNADNPSEIAKNLFTYLRETDKMDCTMILCCAVTTDGIGLAVMNRLLRAAGFDIEEV